MDEEIRKRTKDMMDEALDDAADLLGDGNSDCDIAMIATSLYMSRFQLAIEKRTFRGDLKSVVSDFDRDVLDASKGRGYSPRCNNDSGNYTAIEDQESEPTTEDVASEVCEGWAALDDKGCPFTINLYAHYFRDKKSLCGKYAITDDSNLQESYLLVDYCPICDRAQQLIQDSEPPDEDIAKQRWGLVDNGNLLEIRVKPVEMSTSLMIQRAATDEQMRLVVAAPELLAVLS